MIAFALIVTLAGNAGVPAFRPLAKTNAGWKLEASVPAERAICDGAPLAGGRTLFWCQVSSEDYTKSITSFAFVGADGAASVSRVFTNRTPFAFAASPDGKLVAFSSVDDADPNADPVLHVMDAGGRVLFQRKVDPERVLLAGNGWIAVAEPPFLPETYEHDEDDPAPPPLQVAEAATIFAADGSPLRSAEPIRGAFVNAGDGFAAVANGKLSVHRATLGRRGGAPLPFRIGWPSAGGNTIAVGDVTATEDEREQRQVLLFDADGKKLGELSVTAPLGALAAISADGSAVAAYSASPGDSTPVHAVPGFAEVVLATRDGRERFRKSFATKTDALTSVAVANGGARVALLFKNTEAEGGRVVLLDGSGDVVSETDSNAQRLWIDGDSLVLLGPASIQRVSLRK